MEQQNSGDQGGGIFVSRGVSLRISNIRLIFGPDGVTLPSPTVEVLLNMGPFWLEIAMRHLKDAEQFHAALLVSRNDKDRTALGTALEGEFLAGMQAIVAAATALDALYASVKPHVAVPDAVTLAWRANGTARFKQIAEVLRRGFAIKPRKAVAWRKVLRNVYRFRDSAVHPSSDFAAPVRHPDLTSATERRFIVFSYSNAQQIVRASLAITALVSSKTNEGMPKGLVDTCKGISSLIAPVCKEWRSRYGRLTDDDALEAQGSGL